MTEDLEFELAIFDKADGPELGPDWMRVEGPSAMGWPDSVLEEIPLKVVEELLAKLTNDPTNTADMEHFLGHLRGDLSNAEDQIQLFGGGR